MTKDEAQRRRWIFYEAVIDEIPRHHGPSGASDLAGVARVTFPLSRRRVIDLG